MMLSTTQLLGASILVVFPALSLATPVVEGAHLTTFVRRDLDEHTSIGRIISDTADCFSGVSNLEATGVKCLAGLSGQCTPVDVLIQHTYLKGETASFGCWTEGWDPRNGDLKKYYGDLQHRCWVAGDQIVPEPNAAHQDMPECEGPEAHRGV